jgi:AraC-like DNA-binding protein
MMEQVRGVGNRGIVGRSMDAPGIAGAMTVDTVRGVSPLGAWSYSAWRPAHLGGLVDHLWVYTGPSMHRRKRIFPNGCVEIIVNFGDPYRVVEGAGVELCRTAWLGGPQVTSMVVEQPAYQHVMGVRLRPAGAYAVVARPMREVTGLSVDLADLIGRAADELAERCEAAGSIAGRFRIAAEWVGKRFLRAHLMDGAVAWAVAQLTRTGGVVPIAALRERTGLSRTRLVEAFRDQVGLGPKLYGRVVRFHQTLGLLQGAGATRLTDVALDARFYDQAHMNAEFRTFAGLTPRQFLAARHPVGDGSTAADGPAASP